MAYSCFEGENKKEVYTSLLYCTILAWYTSAATAIAHSESFCVQPKPPDGLINLFF